MRESLDLVLDQLSALGSAEELLVRFQGVGMLLVLFQLLSQVPLPFCGGLFDFFLPLYSLGQGSVDVGKHEGQAVLSGGFGGFLRSFFCGGDRDYRRCLSLLDRNHRLVVDNDDCAILKLRRRVLEPVGQVNLGRRLGSLDALANLAQRPLLDGTAADK